MARIETLNEMATLRESGFGQPDPRHGLKLLYWFATSCVSLENNAMKAMCYPEDGEYGFHPFEDRYERNGFKLLPDVDIPYYEVGNLHSVGADELPHYIRENYSIHDNESNKDRIIVSLDDEHFDRVYITVHEGKSSFDVYNTYRISKGLLRIINQLTLEDFLNEMGYRKKSVNRIIRNQNCQIIIPTTPSAAQQQSDNSNRSKGFWDFFCTIL